MIREEAKRLLAILCITVIVWWLFLTLISYAPLFNDKEFEEAIEWAWDIWIPNVELLQAKPFSYISRSDASAWYVAFAQTNDMLLYNDDICSFNDIDTQDWSTKDLIMLSCMYRFFWGSKWGFFPEAYLTKAWSLVALMKWFYPKRDFESTEPYWEPFVNEAKTMWITKRDSDEYMMYLITKYELLLQLYRAWKWKEWIS